jgi:hypothetical protein
VGVMTAESAFRLCDAILGTAAEHYLEGHLEAVSSRTEIVKLLDKIRLAERAAREGTTIDASDRDTEYFFEAFKAGRDDARE